MSSGTQTPTFGQGDFPPLRVPIRRFSTKEYHELMRTGMLQSGDPVELLEGILVTKMTKYPPHTIATESVCEALRSAIPAGWFIRSQEPITTDDSEPEPDVMVVRGSRYDYPEGHPTPADVALVVEVADDSLARDRGAKQRLYARAKVSTYWIVNLIDRQIEIYTDPTGPTNEPDFRLQEVFGESDLIPLGIDGIEVAKLAVSKLLPQAR